MYKSNMDLLLISHCVFTGLKEKPERGFIAVKGNKIIHVGTGDSYQEWIGDNTVVINLKDQLVTPGSVRPGVYKTI